MAEQVTPMPRKKSNPGQAAKIELDVLRMARMLVAAGDAESVSKLLSDICRPVLRKRLTDLQKQGKLLPPDDKP